MTEGLVVGKRAVGESNTLVILFTREHGLLRVVARSARKEVSKLRYGLEPLTEARFSLVRGRNEWKLTGVERASRELCSSSAENRQRAGKVLHLLMRLVHGEERAGELYGSLADGLKQLSIASPSHADAIECVLVLRMLAHLGYLPEHAELAPFLSHDSYTRTNEARLVRPMLIRIINESLRASGL